MLRAVNRSISRIWRVVVLPQFRSIGVAVRLVRETLPQIQRPYVETLAVMARYNPFFERAGMRRVEVPPTTDNLRYTRALERLAELGFDPALLRSRTHTLRVLQRLASGKLQEVKALTLQFFVRPKFRNHHLERAVRTGQLNAISEALAHGRMPAVYLWWSNGTA